MYSVIKFQSPFERIKLYSSSPEVSLHKAIIIQAIIDASNISNDMEQRKLEVEAKTWLFGNSDDFKEVCDIANISSLEVRRVAKEAISMQKAKLRNGNRRGRRDTIKDRISYKLFQPQIFADKLARF